MNAKGTNSNEKKRPTKSYLPLQLIEDVEKVFQPQISGNNNSSSTRYFTFNKNVVVFNYDECNIVGTSQKVQRMIYERSTIL